MRRADAPRSRLQEVDHLKTFLCRCEDITTQDCTRAITEGYEDFEDLKRFLGVGTGPCQGKACVAAAIRLIAAERGVPPDRVDVMTFRPPVRPIAIETLAAADADDDVADAGDSGGEEE